MVWHDYQASFSDRRMFGPWPPPTHAWRHAITTNQHVPHRQVFSSLWRPPATLVCRVLQLVQRSPARFRESKIRCRGFFLLHSLIAREGIRRFQDRIAKIRSEMAGYLQWPFDLFLQQHVRVVNGFLLYSKLHCFYSGIVDQKQEDWVTGKSVRKSACMPVTNEHSTSRLE